MTIADLVTALRTEADRANERRLLTLAGDRDRGLNAARDACASFDAVTVVTPRDAAADADRLHPDHADRLLGTTRDAVVYDCHEEFSPNVLGRVVGAVDGGGLLVLVTPPLDAWPGAAYVDDRLAVPPFTVDDVTGHFRRRLVGTLRTHPGVAVVDVDEGAVERDGLTDPPPARSASVPSIPADAAFPPKAYETCLTADQADALLTLERLRDGEAVVVEADRGRGKSAAAGLAAGSLAAAGRDVLVTAPTYRNAEEVFERAEALLATLDRLDARDDRTLTATGGGRVRYRVPSGAVALPGDPDAVIVDEAAALPVGRLTAFLDAPAVAFVTTVHGYEGTGRGFDVRFRDHLADAERPVTDARLETPVRYAAGDPVEVWAFRALLLDARPAADQLVENATPADATYRALDAAALADEHLLREAFGLLVLAHYRTEPDDLARLFDAPNLACRALTVDGHVAAVALLAREGGLPESLRVDAYEGQRVRGNMLPDVLTSQLRDLDAGAPVGYRVLRIATHHAVRSTGFGSRLLTDCHDEFDSEVDWFGVGYGATPRLVRFWERNGYRTVHCSTTRNATSGEHSAIMLRPTSDAGRALHDRHARRFRSRMRDGLSDALDDLDPDVARAVLRTTDAAPDPTLTDHGWRVVAAAAFGPGLYDAAPGAFRDLALSYLVDPDGRLGSRAERLLVRKPLQTHDWEAVADDLGYVSTRQCMRAFGEAYRPLVDRYGGDVATKERRRYDGSE
ncbi:MAG: tRNA(Met) cytidine acetyltransferase TmcA [Haloplanus sp.]